MRTIRFLLQKEFRQIFRNRTILAMILVMPVVQLLILPLAANYEVRHVNVVAVDHDHSSYSRQLVEKVSASAYFELVGNARSFREAYDAVETDRADVVLEIPAGFERGLVREGRQEVFVAVNAINGTKANLGGSYLLDIIADFNAGIRPVWAGDRPAAGTRVTIASSNWYNPYMNYRLFMVPGILAILLTMVGGYLSALNIVKEKEAGTMEQINVTPVKKYQFVVGKLVPFWVLGLVVFTLGMTVARVVYGIVPAGSLLLLYGFVAVYLTAVLGFGLLISTISENQQQAMFVSFFFMMIFILMSGLFTSIESMPRWAQWIAAFNPMSYIIEVLRLVVLKGSGLRDVLRHLGIIALFGVVLNTWAIVSYRKRS